MKVGTLVAWLILTPDTSPYDYQFLQIHIEFCPISNNKKWTNHGYPTDGGRAVEEEKDGKKTGFWLHKEGKGSDGTRGVVTCQNPVRWRLSSGHSIARGADWLNEWDTVALSGEPRGQELLIKFGGVQWEADGKQLMPKMPTNAGERWQKTAPPPPADRFDRGPDKDKEYRKVTAVSGTETIGNDQYLLQITIKRDPSKFELDYFSVIWIIDIVAIFCFAIPPEALSNRLQVITALLFTATGMKWTVQDRMPSLP